MANPTPFTPEEVAQILEAFFSVVGTRQYIGARYVPIFGRKGETSIVWDNTAPYEPLTIVLYQGNSFTSRQYVPTGVEITNEEFWAQTGNYNAQVEAYRRETAQALETARTAQRSADAAQLSADAAQGSADAANLAIDAINALLPSEDFSPTNTIRKYIDMQLSERAVNAYHPLTYLGRIVPLAHWGYRYGQGICLLDDTTALVTCTSTNDAMAYIYRVDLLASVVVDVMQSNIGHANDMFYDASENVVLVAPNAIANRPSNDILVCSPSTMSILRTYTLDIRPSCVFKYDDTYYVCTINNSNVSIYKYDANFESRELIVTIPKVETGNRSVAQMVRIYNETIYVLYGGYNAQAIYAFDMQGDITGRIDFDKFIEYFKVSEFESFDVTSDGDFIIYAQATMSGQYSLYCNLICGLNISGKLINPQNVVEKNDTGSNAHVSNIENNYNRTIRPTGSNNLPFPGVEEAVAMSYAGGGAGILLDTDAYWGGYSPIVATAKGPLYINAQGHTLYAGTPFEGTSLTGGGAFGVAIAITNALIKSSGVTRNCTLRFGNCSFWLVGNSKINFENSDNVAPLRFDRSIVAIDSTVTVDGTGTTRSLLMNGSLLATPNDNLSYSGQIARVQ
ncbi:MAG: hypothetical protein IKF78_02035 [Atopobiaceae bacterium]|nr:hypothetical protein [Atopobiaceae bacterium]